MFVLFQPLLTAHMGAALSVFGVYHSVLQLPATVVWRHVVDASPQLLAVLLFLGCVTIAVAGLVLLWSGLRGTRMRMRQLRRVRWPSTSPGSPGYGEGPYDETRW